MRTRLRRISSTTPRISRTVPRFYPEHPEDLPADAGDQHHVSGPGSVPGFQLPENDLLPVFPRSTGTDGIRQAGAVSDVLQGGYTTGLRGAGGLWSVQDLFGEK